MKDPLALDPGDKLGRLIKHSQRLVRKQDEVRKVVREAIARTVEERLRAQNGGYLRLKEYEHMVAFALRQAMLDPMLPNGKKLSDRPETDSELFNALVNKLLDDVDMGDGTFKR